jgi:uncharacterized membrane protein YqjE
MQLRKTTMPVRAMEEESLGNLISALASDSAALVHDELSLAKQELGQKLSSLSNSALIVTIGVLVGVLASMTLCAAAVIALAPYVGAWQSALIVGLVLALIAATVSYTGVRRLKATSLKPEQTLETLEEDKRWLKELT